MVVVSPVPTVKPITRKSETAAASLRSAPVGVAAEGAEDTHVLVKRLSANVELISV